MDEYRAFNRRAPHHPDPPSQEPVCEPEPHRGLIPGPGLLGLDRLEDYLPILLVIVVLVGLYLWLGKQEGGIGGLLGGFLK